MSMKAEIEQALTAHAAWRKRFKDFLGGKAAFDIEAIGDTHRCRFGDWLDHEGYRLMPAERRAEVQEAHDAFHRAAAEIVQKIKDKQYAQAKEDLANDGVLNRASVRMVESLVRAKLYEPAAAATPASGRPSGPVSPAAGPGDPI